jgi:hypothetical protein
VTYPPRPIERILQLIRVVRDQGGSCCARSKPRAILWEGKNLCAACVLGADVIWRFQELGGPVKAALQFMSPASHLLALGAIQISPKKRGAVRRHPPALPNQPTRIAVPSLEQLPAPAPNSIGTDANANFRELPDSWTDGE